MRAAKRQLGCFREACPVLNFILILSYPANHRINLGEPFERRAKARPRQKLRMQRAIAYLNHAIDLAVAPPFPESTPIFPTDNASHWESLFVEEGVAPPLPEIASFVVHLRGLIDAAGGRPVHPVAQTNSSSSGSAQTRTPQDARCCVIS
jgi:hypothetical protein